MKRYLLTIFAVVIILAMVPVNTLALEEDFSEYDELIALACDVFPEYIDNITGNHQNTTTFSISNTQPDVVNCETRRVNENTVLTYTEYSDGTSMIAAEDLTETITLNNYAGGSGGTTYVITLKLAYSGSSQVFIAKNVQYTIASQGYDVINSAGDLSSSTTMTAEIVSVKYSENASGAAYIYYDIEYYTPTSTLGPRNVTYKLYVGNNTRWTYYI